MLGHLYTVVLLIQIFLSPRSGCLQTTVNDEQTWNPSLPEAWAGSATSNKDASPGHEYNVPSSASSNPWQVTHGRRLSAPGAVLAVSTSNAAISDRVIHCNNATEGVVVTANNTTLSHLEIHNCAGPAIIFRPSVGADVLLADVTWHLRLRNVTVYGSQSLVAGGALRVEVPPSGHRLMIQIDGCTFSQNSAPLGGAIWVDGMVALHIVNTVFTSNQAYSREAGAGGGAVYLGASGSLTASNTTFSANRLAFRGISNGGAVYAGSSASVVLEACTFTINNAPNGGGAVYMGPGAVLAMNNSMVSGNQAHGGAGVWLDRRSVSSFWQCQFADNVALNNGSAISCQGCTIAYIASTNFTSNFVTTIDPPFNFVFQPGQYGGTVFIARYDAGPLCEASCAESAHLKHVTDCTFFNNTAAEGAAIQVNGAVIDVVRGCRFVKNVVRRNKLWVTSTGEVFWSDPEVTTRAVLGVLGAGCVSRIEDCSFDGNDGPGIRWRSCGCMMAVRSSNFTANQAVGLPEGGAISVRADDVTCAGSNPFRVDITNSIFRNNSALRGGALVVGLSYTSAVAVSGCTFDGNAAGEEVGGTLDAFGSGSQSPSLNIAGGGAVAFYGWLSVNIYDSTFRNNRAPEGGAVLLQGAAGPSKIWRVTFENNTAGTNGGAISCQGNQNLELQLSNFSSNVAPRGGALSLSDISGSIDTSIFAANAAVQGAAIFIERSQLSRISASGFVGNIASFGAGVYVGQSAQVLLLGNCSLHHHHFTGLERWPGLVAARSSDVRLLPDLITGLSSGAITVREQGYIKQIEFTDFADNDGAERGSALYLYSPGAAACNGCDFPGMLTVRQSSFRNNSATSSGGAVYLANTLAVEFSGCVFEGNTVTGTGGALAVESSSKAPLNISDCSFANNAAAGGGGAVALSTVTAPVLLFRCNLTANQAAGGGGGGILGTSLQNLLLSNVTLRQNSAANGGAVALLSHNGLARILGCAFQDNTAVRELPLTVRATSQKVAMGGGLALLGALPMLLLLQESTFDGNSAEFGGSISADLPSCQDAVPCSLIHIAATTTFMDSSASNPAGGAVVFSAQPASIHVQCHGALQLPPEQQLREALLPTGLDANLSALPDFIPPRDRTFMACTTWNSGAREQAGPARGVATGPQQLLLEADVDLSFYSSNTPITFTLVLLDAFGVEVPADTLLGNIAASVTASDLSALVGERAALFINGRARLSGLRLRSHPQAINLTFSVLELPRTVLTVEIRSCMLGEVVSREGDLCIPCDGPSEYSFQYGAAACTRCPDAADCSKPAAGIGALLLPRDGQWHSSPLSPQMHRCLNADACTFAGRHQALSRLSQMVTEQLANSSSNTLDSSAIQALRNYTDMAQCRRGYSGRLCAACESGWGGIPPSRCVRCPPRGLNTIYYLLITMVNVALISFTIGSLLLGNMQQAAGAMDSARPAQPPLQLLSRSSPGRGASTSSRTSSSDGADNSDSSSEWSDERLAVRPVPAGSGTGRQSRSSFRGVRDTSVHTSSPCICIGNDNHGRQDAAAAKDDDHRSFCAAAPAVGTLECMCDANQRAMELPDTSYLGHDNSAQYSLAHLEVVRSDAGIMYLPNTAVGHPAYLHEAQSESDITDVLDTTVSSPDQRTSSISAQSVSRFKELPPMASRTVLQGSCQEVCHDLDEHQLAVCAPTGSSLEAQTIFGVRGAAACVSPVERRPHDGAAQDARPAPLQTKRSAGRHGTMEPEQACAGTAQIGYTIRPAVHSDARLAGGCEESSVTVAVTAWPESGTNIEDAAARAETGSDALYKPGAHSRALASIPPPVHDTGDAEHGTDVFMKILVSYLQVLSMVGGVKLQWPGSLASFYAAASQVASQLSSAISLDCSISSRAVSPAIQRTLITISLPVMLMIVALPTWLVLQVTVTALRQTALAAGFWRTLRLRMLLTANVIVFFLYPNVTQALLSIYACVQLDKPDPAPSLSSSAVGLFWGLDSDLRCYERQHLWLAIAVGVPGVLLFCLGVPLGSAAMLWWRRRRLAEHGDFALVAGFLYRDYRAACYWWESIVVLRKLAVVSAVVFLAPHGVLPQLLTVLGVIMLSLLLQIVFRPFGSHPLANIMEEVTLAATAATFFASLYFLLREVQGPLRAALAGVLIAANCVTVSVLAALIVKGAVELLRQTTPKVVRRVRTLTRTLTRAVSVRASAGWGNAPVQPSSGYVRSGPSVRRHGQRDLPDSAVVQERPHCVLGTSRTAGPQPRSWLPTQLQFQSTAPSSPSHQPGRRASPELLVPYWVGGSSASSHSRGVQPARNSLDATSPPPSPVGVSQSPPLPPVELLGATSAQPMPTTSNAQDLLSPSTLHSFGHFKQVQ